MREFAFSGMRGFHGDPVQWTVISPFIESIFSDEKTGYRLLTPDSNTLPAAFGGGIFQICFDTKGRFTLTHAATNLREFFLSV